MGGPCRPGKLREPRRMAASLVPQLLLSTVVMLPMVTRLPTHGHATNMEPAWDWDIPAHQTASHCLEVPTTNGSYYNSSVQWTNNSRAIFVAVPEGSPPAEGWPVLVDLAIIPYRDWSLGSAGRCGEQGAFPPQLAPSPSPQAQECQDALTAACSSTFKASGDFVACTACVNNHSAAAVAHFAKKHCMPGNGGYQNGTNRENFALSHCPMPPSLPTSCGARLLAGGCIATRGITRQKVLFSQCQQCVWQRMFNDTNPATSTSNGYAGCPRLYGQQLLGHCGRPPKDTSFWDRPTGPLDISSSWQSPHTIGQQCACINGTEFECTAPSDDGHGGQLIPPSVLHGLPGRCDLNIFFGTLWWQRVKQYAIANGIAVLVVNPFTFDGWESWPAEWANGHGYDPPFFRRLGDFLGDTAAPPHFRALNPRKLAFRGWSGGAQMVSWIFQLAAEDQLGPNFGVVAGLLAAGGSYVCYDSPPLARGTCANCSDAPGPLHPGCSSDVVASGQSVNCQMCCPEGFTEQHYFDNPEQYQRHPWTFLVQTEVDQGADSCASVHYHSEMLRHGARSELYRISANRTKCYAVGEPGDPAVPPSDHYASLCASPNMVSLNHSQAAADMVLPFVLFLQDAFANHSSIGSAKA